MKRILLSLIMALAVLVSGCSTTSGTGTRQLAAKLAVTYATMKVIERNPAYAERIVVISREVQAVAGGGKAATVKLLVELIKAEIRWNTLSPADAMVINLLVDEIGAQLAARVGDGQLDGVSLLYVKEVAQWVEQAAVISTPSK